MLGDFYFADGDLDKATDEYGSLHHDHPKDLQVTKNYVQLLILKNRLDEANKLNEEILKTNPREADALVFRGEIQLRHGDANGSVDSLQQAIKNDPENGVAHYQLGLAYEAQNNGAEAESELHQAVTLRPDITDAQRSLATLELRQGNFDGLAQTAEQIIRSAPNSPDGYLTRAAAEVNRKEFSAAEQDMHKAAEVAPTSPAPYVALGNLHQLQKQYPVAIKFYQQALDHDPASTEGLQGLMNTYLAEKQIDQAVAVAKAQIAKSPNSSGFYDLLARRCSIRRVSPTLTPPFTNPLSWIRTILTR